MHPTTETPQKHTAKAAKPSGESDLPLSQSMRNLRMPSRQFTSARVSFTFQIAAACL